MKGLVITYPILGPNKSRGCTDVICCIVYLAFIGFWFAIAAVAFKNGNPTQILLPTSSSGELCGDGDAIGTPYLLYFDLTKCTSLDGLVTSNLQCPTYQQCVATCPDEFWSFFTNELPQIAVYDQNIQAGQNIPFADITCGTTTGDLLGAGCVDIDAFTCKPQFQSRINDMVSGVIPPAEVLSTFTTLIENGDCAPYTFPSEPTMKRCLPLLSTNETEANANLTDNGITDQNNNDVTFTELTNGLQGLIQTEAQDFFRSSVADLQNTWPMILIILGIAMVVSFLWIFLMRWIAAPLIWLSFLNSTTTCRGSIVY